MPTPMRMVWGSAIAYWLSGIINPAFVAIAVMIALFIPILISEYLFPDTSHLQPDLSHEHDMDHHHQHDMNHHAHDASQKSLVPSHHNVINDN